MIYVDATMSPLVGDLLSGLVPTLAIVVATAAVHRFNKSQDGKKSVVVDLESRVKALEVGVNTLNVGLFGEKTPFGKKPGFVDQVMDTMQEHGKDIKLLVADTKHNGGSSSKDDLTAIRRAVEGTDEAPS